MTEFFIAQGQTGAQVIIETTPFGSSSVTVGGDSTVIASLDAAVITLTGVNVEDLQFSNGVISHAA